MVPPRFRGSAVNWEHIQQFLLWAIVPDDANQKYLASVNFIPLPARTWELSHDQIKLIK